MWVVSVCNGGCFDQAVTEIAPQWAASVPGASGLIWHFGTETDLSNLQCVSIYTRGPLDILSEFAFWDES